MQLIDTQAAMRPACAALTGAAWLAVDTEFVRERTYFPVPCLVQIASADAVFGFDLVALDDLQPLMDLIFDRNCVKVLHAPRQDLEIFFQLTGKVPQPVFDTQLAAAMCGHDEQVSYGGLVSAVCGEELPKDSTRTDWTRRPLSPAQLAYAANDVTWLRMVYQRLRDELD
ncbi:MAG: ribonuclease D, partial [Gammaproteobacteria bacterium]|nr:ribonuclease D [Gammaproteobacteria bacterium]